MSQHTLRQAAAAALALLACGAGFAQSLKPGLWEISSKMQSSNPQAQAAMAQAQAQMASMPPAQRKMIEDMMAKQGVGLPGAGAGGATAVRLCMTREMLDQGQIAGQQSEDCKTTTSARTGNTMKVSYVCTRPPSSGEGTVTFVSPEAYNTQMKVNATVQGKAETMNVDASGKWLAADCGNIRPISAPKK